MINPILAKLNKDWIASNASIKILLLVFFPLIATIIWLVTSIMINKNVLFASIILLLTALWFTVGISLVELKTVLRSLYVLWIVLSIYLFLIAVVVHFFSANKSSFITIVLIIAALWIAYVPLKYLLTKMHACLKKTI